MRQKRLNDEEKKRLIADKRNGMKDADIARKYGCNTSTVSVIARAAGLTRPARKQAETLQELLDRWDESMPKIRKQCGFDRMGVDTDDIEREQREE